MMLEWFGLPYQQNHVRASAIVVSLRFAMRIMKTTRGGRHVLNSLSWVEGSFGCDLQ